MIKPPFVGQGEKITEVLALVHTNVCSRFDMPAKGGYIYFITFIDDYLWYEYVYLMRHKSETFEKFKEFRFKVEKQIKKTLKILWLDQRGEYLTRKSLDCLKKNDIVSQ